MGARPSLAFKGVDATGCLLRIAAQKRPWTLLPPADAINMSTLPHGMCCKHRRPRGRRAAPGEASALPGERVAAVAECGQAAGRYAEAQPDVRY